MMIQELDFDDKSKKPTVKPTSLPTRLIEITTCNHLGDAVCLTAPMLTVKTVLGESAALRYRGNYGEVFNGLGLGEWPEGAMPTDTYRVDYRSHSTPDNRAQGGNLTEGMYGSLSRHLGIKLPVSPVPELRLTKDEIDYALSTLPPSAALINTNTQRCSTIKGYPWWAEVIRQLKKVGYTPVLTGGREERDIRGDLPRLPDGILDLRGQTTIRQMIAIVSRARIVLSPPSSIVHIAAAFGIPTVCITGAREPTGLTAYPNTVHIHTVCTASHLYNKSRGCMHFRMEGCERPVVIRERQYPSCMACVPAELVVETALRLSRPKRPLRTSQPPRRDEKPRQDINPCKSP